MVTPREQQNMERVEEDQEEEMGGVGEGEMVPGDEQIE